MEKILFPTRGGEASYINQDKAVDIALERNAELLFLYISNIDFSLSTSSPIRIKLIQDDLEDMGEFMLAIAQERAEKRGCTANTLLKRGVFSDILKEVIQENNITTLMIGSSPESEGHTTSDYIEKLTKLIYLEFGIEVLVVCEGEIIKKVPETDDKPSNNCV
ncbi:MAG: universal stress protein [Anaerolineaceae bacterium]|nr:universal stress protein [Anaerolineaceae bacterium]